MGHAMGHAMGHCKLCFFVCFMLSIKTEVSETEMSRLEKKNGTKINNGMGE